MRLSNILVVAISLLMLSSCATKKKLKLADKLYDNGSYYNAADNYSEVQQKKENNSRVAFQLAETNRHLKDYEQAAKWYKRTLDLNEKAWPEARFQYAEMLKSQEKYDEAIKEFEAFSKSVDSAKKKKGPEADMLNQMKRKTKVAIEGAKMAKELMEEKPESEVNTIDNGLNNNLQDYAPKYVSENKLLMSALLSEDAVNLDASERDDEDYYSKLFFATEKGGEWEREMLPDNINSSKSHVGNGVLSKDGKTLYFTKCDEANATKMVCQIYSSTKTANGWSDPKLLPNVNRKGFTSTQPALGVDLNGDDVLYFVSDRTGGRGGLDIWYAVLGKDGSVSNPKNLGNSVNTPFDEVTPFYDAKNSVLYFSSDGHAGFGGLDVFKVEGNVDNWSKEVVNMGYPLNSGADDLYLALNDAGKKGYMVSNRVGTTSLRGKTCCDDVFRVRLTREFYLVVTAVDSLNTILSGVDITLYQAVEGNYEPVASGLTRPTEEVVFVVDEDDYKINGTKDGFWPGIATLSAEELGSFSGDTLYKEIVLRAINRVKIKNVYFAFDKFNIREMYEKELDSIYSLMMKYEQLIVKIEGHTDGKGTVPYNQVLSENRAKAAKKYLVAMGVPKDRILTVGYGKLQPIAPNENPDGSDNPEGRAKNRRVEFKLLSDVNDEDLPFTVEYSDEGPSTID
jgi:outer membrane protein OmpA-like peptidoglycan-associated protein